MLSQELNFHFELSRRTLAGTVKKNSFKLRNGKEELQTVTATSLITVLMFLTLR